MIILANIDLRGVLKSIKYEESSGVRFWEVAFYVQRFHGNFKQIPSYQETLNLQVNAFFNFGKILSPYFSASSIDRKLILLLC